VGAPSAAATMVPGYRHRPGNHCGSTALRNLLAFHGVPISEEMAFGLGAGACFYFIPMEGSPSRFLNGRTARLEESFVEHTGAPLELRTFDGPDESWQGAREAVDSGAPALLLTDLYYLDHYGSSAHFPGHAVVLAGYDDELTYLSDTAFEELQTTALPNLARARHSQHPVFPLAGHMFVAAGGLESFDPLAAAPAAIAAAATRMLEPPMGEFEGVPALRRFAAEVGSWPELLDDWVWTARFAYQVIERRGTGGGNFRPMYARFLAECGRDEGTVAATAGDAWSALATSLLAASEAEEPDAASWGRIAGDAGRVLESEERLWESLAQTRS